VKIFNNNSAFVEALSFTISINALSLSLQAIHITAMSFLCPKTPNCSSNSWR